MSRRAAPAILFDFGGTLDDDGRWWCVRFHDAYRAAGGRLDFAAFEPRFAASDRVLLELPGIAAMGFRATVDAQAELLRTELAPDDAVSFEVMAERFWAESVATIERNRALLEGLRARYRLGVVSNFTGNLEPCLVELGLRPLFHTIMDSAVAGVAKPDPRIFLDAMRELGAEPETTWMVGDNFEKDIRPARQLGLRACWLADEARPAPNDCPPPLSATARISRLPQLVDLLD